MARNNRPQRSRKKRKVKEAISLLQDLGFKGRQCNDSSALVLLALLGMSPDSHWSNANAPLIGITPIINFLRSTYGVKYAPNTRETIRDESVKYFVAYGLLVRNPDDPHRPVNSGKTVYQIESNALSVIRTFGSDSWPKKLAAYLVARDEIQTELTRRREMSRIPVTIGDDVTFTLSPGGQNPLIKSVVEEFCSRFTPGGKILYVGDAEGKFLQYEKQLLAKLGVEIDSPEKMPDVVVHYNAKNWLVLIEAVVSVGPVDGKRRLELKQLFRGARAGLVFVTAFETKLAFRKFAGDISWETEVWIADDPDHLIHFDGERFLGPYEDVAVE